MVFFQHPPNEPSRGVHLQESSDWETGAQHFCGDKGRAVGRIAERIELTLEERRMLERWMRATSCEQRLVERARIGVLLAAEGHLTLGDRPGCGRDASDGGQVVGAVPGGDGWRRWGRSRFGRPPVYGRNDRPHRQEGHRTAPRSGVALDGAKGGRGAV